jgi:hypothetical protein
VGASVRTSYTVRDVEDIENKAYQAGIAVGESMEQARIVELLESEKELASGFSSVNKRLDDLIALVRGYDE